MRRTGVALGRGNRHGSLLVTGGRAERCSQTAGHVYCRKRQTTSLTGMWKTDYPMILYKYLQRARLDVLKAKKIRFTQPGDFNDPFEFRPRIQSVASEEHVRAYVEDNFEQLVEQQLDKYGALIKAPPQPALKELLYQQKARIPELFRLLEPPMIAKVSSLLDGALNQNVGVLCLSEVRDSILMWGHYAENHRGFVVGFDSKHPFFSLRRTEQDEFGILRQVDYQRKRPIVTLSDTSSPAWFQTKSEQWAYEKEWRIVRVLSDANCQLQCTPFPICLFDFPADAVLELIVGMRSAPSFVADMRSIAIGFPKAVVLQAHEDPSDYALVIEELS